MSTSDRAALRVSSQSPDSFGLRTMLAVCATVVEGCLGALLVVWEGRRGPMIDAGGYEQDHGGYILGVPILAAALVATVTLVAGRRSVDRSSRAVLESLAWLSLSAPLIVGVVATARGVLHVSLLWSE